MSDIIQLLPDNIANQIAAGEVIQRPASAVKELLENAVDAGATEIKLIIQDAGKALIQVIDNGKGMSEGDARLCFERHATSKIRNIDDLFSIRTMGFRGEALASIAAVAQVVLKTRRQDDEAGTLLEVENSAVTLQEPCATSIGTSIAMKNLFFNIPARRNFLKSNAAEMRHIVDEFIRVAMAFPHILFTLSSNNQELFHLEKGSLKQRIVQILGSQYASKLVAVQEQTDYMNIHGFVGKPDTARKTRGDQYFFVNNRFIKSGYLHHALMNAYQDLIPADSFPMYVLFIELDPSQVDINVHPTKQEIKFEDEKIIYAFVQAAVKHALAQFSITPTLDFDLDMNIQQLDAVNKPFTDDKKSAAASSSLYQAFTQKNQAHFIEKSPVGDWKSFFEPSAKKEEGFALPGLDETIASRNSTPEDRFEYEIPAMAMRSHSMQAVHSEETMLSSKWGVPEDLFCMQLHQSFILVQTHIGFIVVHQQLAHERILYDRYAIAMTGKPVPSQQLLFPSTIDLSPQDAVLLQELLPDLHNLGYQLGDFGGNSFVIQGTPADVTHGNEKQAIENLLEQIKHFSGELKFSKREKLVRSLATQHAVKAGQQLGMPEMKKIVTELFRCNQPNTTANGHPTFVEFKKDYLEKMFMGR